MLYKLEQEHQNSWPNSRKEEILQSSRIISSRFKPVYGITIDNHPRPGSPTGRGQRGLRIRGEGITRYLALFHLPQPGRAHPQRRTSTILALENDVRLIYASASNDVLNFIKSLPLRHTNALSPAAPASTGTTPAGLPQPTSTWPPGLKRNPAR